MLNVIHNVTFQVLIQNTVNNCTPYSSIIGLPPKDLNITFKHVSNIALIVFNSLQCSVKSISLHTCPATALTETTWRSIVKSYID